MRAFILAGFAVLAAPAFAEELEGAAEPKTPMEMIASGYQPDTYRFGGTYAVLNSETFSDCQSKCNADNDCSAWSFTSATQTSLARCELKFSLGNGEFRPGTVSGFNPRAFGLVARVEKNEESAVAEIASEDETTLAEAAHEEEIALGDPASVPSEQASFEIVSLPSPKPEFDEITPIETDTADPANLRTKTIRLASFMPMEVMEETRPIDEALEAENAPIELNPQRLFD